MTTSEALVRPLKQEIHSEKPTLARTFAEAPLSRREKAIASDGNSSMELSLALLWRELMGGLCRVVDGFFTHERCYLVLAQVGSGTPIDPRRREILESVLCGAGQKNIAMELKLAPSTVALNARLALEALGISSKPSRVHPLLMLAARAGRDNDSSTVARLSFVPDAGDTLRVIALSRPDRTLSSFVPPAELAVVRALVEGHCYREIARQRGTSTRTIANQITAVFRRMRVSGRNELLQRLFYADGATPTPLLRPHTETLVPPDTSSLLNRRRTA
jgi:DNA-binding NarL/FixJ family response regulator